MVVTMKQYTANLSDGSTMTVKASNPDYALEAAEEAARKLGKSVRSVVRVVPVGHGR